MATDTQHPLSPEARDQIKTLMIECMERNQAIDNWQAKYNALKTISESRHESLCAVIDSQRAQNHVLMEMLSDLETYSNDHAEMVLIVASARRQLQEVS